MSTAEYAAQKMVAAVNRDFYRAFESRDLATMAALWVPSNDVRCIHPGGDWLVGIGPVLSSWKAVFEGTPPLSFELLDPAVHVEGDAAWVTLIEQMCVTEREEEMESRAAATNVFRLFEGRWRLWMHHASPITRRFQP